MLLKKPWGSVLQVTRRGAGETELAPLTWFLFPAARSNGKRGYGDFNASAQQWKLLLSLSPDTWQVARLAGAKTHKLEGASPPAAPVEVDEGQRSARSSPANSTDLLKCQRSPSCAAFSSWSTPVASARQRHDSVALELAEHAQWGAGSIQLGGRCVAQVTL